MSANVLEMIEEVSNPLDTVEEILNGNDWTFVRLHPDELSVQVTGKNSTYNLTFIWQEEYSAMQFVCEYDLFIPKHRRELTARALAAINEKLWLGHFDVPEERGSPCFRHTSLFRGMTQNSGAEPVEDMVEIALAECERHHNIFSMLATSISVDDSIFSLMLADEAGKA